MKFTIKDLIKELENGKAPDHVVMIAGHDSEHTEIMFEAYSVRWEDGAVVIEADLKK